MRAIELRVAAVVDQIRPGGDGAEGGEDDERGDELRRIAGAVRQDERDENEEVLAPMQRTQRGDDSQGEKLYDVPP